MRRTVLPALPTFFSRAFAVHRACGFSLLTVCRRASVMTSACAGGRPMDFYTLLDQVIALLRQRQRMTYRALQRQLSCCIAAGLARWTR